MHILYVSQYFPPEMGAPAARVHELSREWVRQGHRVTVLTGFAHHPTGRKRTCDRGCITRRETLDGIDVLRTYVYATPNRGRVRRMASYLSFMMSAVVVGSFRVKRPDVVIGTSPQLLAALGARLLAWRFRAPFVFEVRDLWPESIMAVEAMKENVVVRGLARVAKVLYRTSRLIVTVGDGYRRQIAKRYAVPEEKMRVIPNGIDRDLFVPSDRLNAVREHYGWGSRFVVLYMGTHGMAHGLDVLLGAAYRLRDCPEILIAMVGEGAEKAGLEKRAQAMDLSNLHFIGEQEKNRVPAFYAACDLGVVTLRDTDLFRDVLPSKLFEYMAMERPLLVAAEGEPRRVVGEAGAGVYVPPGDPEALAAEIRRLAMQPDELKKMGRSGRKWVLEHHDRKVLALQYLEYLML
jgi:glycosyltransferase involved in cell wall biosynthesis